MSRVKNRIGLLATLLAISGQPASAEALPSQIAVNGVEFVLIPAGPFSYTVENGERFTPQAEGQPRYRQARVWLDDFYIAKYEATAKDLARFLNAPTTPDSLKQEHTRVWREGGKAEKRSGVGCTLHQSADGRFIEADPSRRLPATYLTWPVANAFAEELGFRLPTDAEWQKAARGTDQRVWPWGNSYPDDTYGHFAAGRYCQPVELGTYPKGRSPYGLYDMTGNVAEIVADWYDHSHDAQIKDGVRNPLSWVDLEDETPPGRNRIRHGGGWSANPHSFPIAYRRLYRSDRASNQDGVRFALDATVVRELIEQGKLTRDSITPKESQP